MKAFTFIHSYICGIQVGIQAGHSIVELMNLYSSTDPGKDPLVDRVQEWASEYKTFVWLEGGDSDNIDDLCGSLLDSGIPWSSFNEPSMYHLLTSISLVLTEEQVDLTARIRAEGLYYLNDPLERLDDLIDFLDNDYKVAFTVNNLKEAEVLSAVANARSKKL